MSHYGRHGSRWLISENSYTVVTEPLQKARQQGKLTAKGEETLKALEDFVSLPVANYPALEGQYSGAQLRLGDLTTVGERQHHGIAKRMVHNFPEIFKKEGVHIDARSTTVVRCILSMAAECEELAAANPTARIHNDVSKALQYYLNAPRKGLIESMGRKGRDLRKQMRNESQVERLMQLLFNDQQWVSDSIKSGALMYNLFEVVTNMQSHDNAPDLYALFTDDEIYDQWRIRNIGWYLDYGPATAWGSVQPFSQLNLLKDIIEVADTTRQTAAVLRFGHEVCVMPLACLLELGHCGYATDNMETLDEHWRNYDIFPMACNIQLVFYRPVSGKKGDTLVKALLNEREVTLPIETRQYPYYRWQDLRKYYTEKIAAYEAKVRALEEHQQSERRDDANQ
jgi:hypothetical protein